MYVHKQVKSVHMFFANRSNTTQFFRSTIFCKSNTERIHIRKWSHIFRSSFYFSDRIRHMEEGNVFSLFIGGRGYLSRSGRGQGVPQGTYLPRPRYLPPPPGQMGVPQGTYPPHSRCLRLTIQVR